MGLNSKPAGFFLLNIPRVLNSFSRLKLPYRHRYFMSKDSIKMVDEERKEIHRRMANES